MKRILFFFVVLLIANATQAQTTFLNRLRADETGKGKVTITQSKDIDLLVNGNASGKKANAEREQASNENSKHSLAQDKNPNATEDTDAEPVVDTRKKMMRNSYKTTGYRVQAFSGGNSRKDRLKAEEVGINIKRIMPDEPVYVHFYSPSWKCRVGNYVSLEEARAALAEIKKIYPQACLVKGTINVQY